VKLYSEIAIDARALLHSCAIEKNLKTLHAPDEIARITKIDLVLFSQANLRRIFQTAAASLEKG
jgi:hypothetical protein